MSRGDGWSVAATLVIAGIAYFIGGAKAAIGAIVVGVLIGLYLHLTKGKHGKVPARGDYHQSQCWDSLADRFGRLEKKPFPIWAQWTYTAETNQYKWTIRHSSDVAISMCIELSKEAGRLLLAEPTFKTKFPAVAAIVDAGDRWCLAVHKVGKMGKVSVLGGATQPEVLHGEMGEIKDFPGASQVLCQMARNGF